MGILCNKSRRGNAPMPCQLTAEIVQARCFLPAAKCSDQSSGTTSDVESCDERRTAKRKLTIHLLIRQIAQILLAAHNSSPATSNIAERKPERPGTRAAASAPPRSDKSADTTTGKRRADDASRLPRRASSEPVSQQSCNAG